MNLKTLLKIFSDKDCETIYVKELVPNNNSKQQIYVSRGDTQILNVFPVKDFKAELKGNAKSATFHATCTFFWVDDDGNKFLAPNAKFILYPKYPEVRFSGFIQGCDNAPTTVLNNAVHGRFLFFGISKSDELLGYVSDANTDVSNEFSNLKDVPKIGILFTIALSGTKLILDTKQELLKKLKEIYSKGWIDSKQLKPGFIIAPCEESRCGGLTLEAELGIIQNARSEPDFLGWEIKQFAVKKFNLIDSSRITLMTPEPDGGIYKINGGIEFVRQYGYNSIRNADRMDFTGRHFYDKIQKKSDLIFSLDGYDFENRTIDNANGGIFLIDKSDNIAASWSFAKMLAHWNKKHAKASYVPSVIRKDPKRQYKYSNKIMLGEGTDFSLFLDSFLSGKIYYDPGIHVDIFSGKSILKARSQFRISSKHIKELYKTAEIIDLDEF